MNKIFSFVAILVAILSAAAQTQTFVGHSENGNYVTISTSEGNYQLIFLNTNIVSVLFAKPGDAEPKASHAVVLTPIKTAIKVTDKNGFLTYDTGGISVQIRKSPLAFNFFYHQKQLVSAIGNYTAKDSLAAIGFRIDSTEALYGGGARVLGMNRRGNRLQLYNRAHYGYETRSELMNFTMPIAISSKMYMIHFDNASTGWLDFDSSKTNRLAFEMTSGPQRYQVIAGDSWQNLISNYTALTGRQPMPPRWAFGNFASRFGYHSQAEAEMTIKKFRDEKIPVDAIILDLYWFGKDIKGTMGNLSVFRDSFPEFESMVQRFKNDHIKTITVTEPFILTTSSRWQEAVDNSILATDSVGKPYTYDFYFGNTGLIDIFKPEAKTWFWNIYKDLAHKGIAGVWGDLGEPEVHPENLYHVAGKANDVHNIYGHEWAKTVFQGYQSDFPKQRPFILMRAGYSGSQHYGMIPWSGDVNRTWGGLSGQPEIALQMGMQGMAYMHSDLGGFAGKNRDPELYARWLQYGVFQPIFRPHAQEEVPSEPVFWDDATKALAKKSIELRYKMLPYNYTLAFLNHRDGIPLMRPLFFEEASNSKLYGNAEEYLWGDSFLVVPIKEGGVKGKDVYFPKGSNWFEPGVKKYTGGTTFRVSVYPDRIPYFVRGGSFVPIIESKIESTAEYNPEKLSVQYFHDSDVKESTGIFYDDDGAMPDAYENGNYEILHFSSKVKGRSLKLTVESEKGANFTTKTRTITFLVYDMNKLATYPLTVKSGEKKTLLITLKK